MMSRGRASRARTVRAWGNAHGTAILTRTVVGALSTKTKINLPGYLRLCCFAIGENFCMQLPAEVSTSLSLTGDARLKFLRNA